MVERLHGMQEVNGSRPLSSKALSRKRLRDFCVHSRGKLIVLTANLTA